MTHAPGLLHHAPGPACQIWTEKQKLALSFSHQSREDMDSGPFSQLRLLEASCGWLFFNVYSLSTCLEHPHLKLSLRLRSPSRTVDKSLEIQSREARGGTPQTPGLSKGCSTFMHKPSLSPASHNTLDRCSHSVRMLFDLGWAVTLIR